MVIVLNFKINKNMRPERKHVKDFRMFIGESVVEMFEVSDRIKRLQTALVQIGGDQMLPIHGIDSKFGPETKGATVSTLIKAKEEGHDVPDYNAEVDDQLINRIQDLADKGFTIKKLPDEYAQYYGRDNWKDDFVVTGSGDIQHKYSGEKKDNINLLEKAMEEEGITNPYAKVAILSVIGKESNFIPKSEHSYSSTSNERLRKLFGARLRDLSDEELSKLKKNDVAFYDKIYGPEAKEHFGWDTGNDSPGDGYKYRGRGFNQITFKSTYEKYSDLLGIDLVSDPDKLNDPKVAADAAVAFLLNRLKEKNINPNGFESQELATHTMTQANAGWAKNIEGSESLAKATKYAETFNVV